jgi:hypothetical protein
MIEGYGGNEANIREIRDAVAIDRSDVRDADAMDRLVRRPGRRVPPRGAGLARDVAVESVPRHRHQHQGAPRSS